MRIPALAAMQSDSHSATCHMPIAFACKLFYY